MKLPEMPALPPGVEAEFSPTEGEILEFLWHTGGATAREIADQMGADRGWTMGTVTTFLNRLLAKGWIVVGERLRWRERKFVVALPRDEVVHREISKVAARWVTGLPSLDAARVALEAHARAGGFDENEPEEPRKRKAVT